MPLEEDKKKSSAIILDYWLIPGLAVGWPYPRRGDSHRTPGRFLREEAYRELTGEQFDTVIRGGYDSRSPAPDPI